MKRFISALTALCIVTGSFAVYADNFTAVYAEEISSGICGENLTWTLDTDGTLTINGTGSMTQYKPTEGEYPEWYEHKDKITKVIINGAEDISDRAFYTFPELTDLIISDSVERIGAMAFTGCEKLESITVPESVNSVGTWAFYGTKWLSDRQAENPYVVINDILIDASTKTIDAYGIPQVREIADLAFKDTDITNVYIPETVEKIGKGAFMGCTNLINVSFGHGEDENGKPKYNLKEIGQSAFFNCSSLESITLPPLVSRIEKNTFADSGLKEIILNENINYIGEKAFSMCSDLEKIIIENPGCEIFDSDDTICSMGVITDEAVNVFGGKICGHTGSTAQEYAEKYNCKFRSLDYKYTAGDANMDGSATISDSVAILQYLANPQKYALSEDAKVNADVFNTGDGITGNDAVSLQKFDAGSISKLPESFDDTYTIWNSGDVFQWFPKEVKEGRDYVPNDRIKLNSFPEKTFVWEKYRQYYTNGSEDIIIEYGGSFGDLFFADLNDDGYPEMCVSHTIGSGMVLDAIFVYDLHNDKNYSILGDVFDDHYKFQIDKETGQLTVYKWYDNNLGSHEILIPKIINDELVLE
ncbi:MAG: leucine-rich repeat protein [Ruminococcus sp.]|nr:leucine-rich repeat protein [Ruminococcus sp.]